MRPGPADAGGEREKRLSPALELAANPRATRSEYLAGAGLGAFSDLIREEVEHLAGPRGTKRPGTLQAASCGMETAGASGVGDAHAASKGVSIAL